MTRCKEKDILVTIMKFSRRSADIHQETTSLRLALLVPITHRKRETRNDTQKQREKEKERERERERERNRATDNRSPFKVHPIQANVHIPQWSIRAWIHEDKRCIVRAELARGFHGTG